MADDTIREFRAASVAAEDYLNIECGRRVGRGAAILKDISSDISDSPELRLASLAHAFVFEYFEGAGPERSLEGCLREFIGLTAETLEGLFDFDEWNGAVDSYLEASEDILDGYSKDSGFDPRSLASFPCGDPLRDDGLASEDPEACIEGHLSYVPDSMLQHLLDTVQLINGRNEGRDRMDGKDLDTRAVLALLRSIHLADEQLAEEDDEDDEPEGRIDLKPRADPDGVRVRRAIKGPDEDEPQAKDKVPPEGRIPRFEASNGEVRVEFVFGGDPRADTQGRPRARRQAPSRGLGLLRQEPQVHQDDVHRGLPQ